MLIFKFIPVFQVFTRIGLHASMFKKHIISSYCPLLQDVCIALQTTFRPLAVCSDWLAHTSLSSSGVFSFQLAAPLLQVSRLNKSLHHCTCYSSNLIRSGLTAQPLITLQLCKVFFIWCEQASCWVINAVTQKQMISCSLFFTCSYIVTFMAK